MHCRVSLGQRTNSEPPPLGNATDANRDFVQWRTELWQETAGIHLKAKERQPVVIGSRPEHWRTGEHCARDRGLQRRNEEPVIATTWRAEWGEG